MSPDMTPDAGTSRTTAALVREVGGPFCIEQVDLEPLAEGEVLVEMRGVGVCHTDLAAQAGGIFLEPPFVLGHEGAGVVASLGPGVDALSVGDHVVLSFDHCQQCPQCSSGHPAYCELHAGLNYCGTRLDGSTTMTQDSIGVRGSWFGQSSFATYAVASERNAVRVPDDLPLEMLGPLACGLLTGAGTVFNVLKPRRGQSLAVLGTGAVGCAAIMAARYAGCDPIIGVDLNSDRLGVARTLGATHTIHPSDTHDVAEAVADIVGQGVDFAVETVGSGPVVRQALEMLRTTGLCVTLGVQAPKNNITIDQGRLLMGRGLMGVLVGDAEPHVGIPHLIELWRQGDFPFDSLIETFPFGQIGDAVEAMNTGKTIKPVLTFHGH